jgi:GntR family transcriptional regulator, transcriptional repressor for pyruvate dehydrogenase complex
MTPGARVAKKVGDNLVRTILGLIFQGKLSAGERLPSIVKMTREYRMSAVSVREAIQKLSLMGLVHIRQGGGTFLDRNIPSIIDILDARKYVEMATAFLAARNATVEERERLVRIVEGMEEDFRNSDFVAYTKKDLEFHLAIARMSGNVLLSAFLVNIQDLLYYLQERTHMLQGTIEKAYRFHRQIAEAIMQRDGATAQILITEHIEAVKRAWEAYDRGNGNGANAASSPRRAGAATGAKPRPGTERKKA